VNAHVDLTGDEGLVTKTLTFFTSVGERDVTLEVIIPPPPRQPDQPLTEDERVAARMKATADGRAIFQEGCAVCHVEKARGLLGRSLYVAACGICHDSPRRASMVPDLRALKQATNLLYWQTIITKGKPHSMMPGFAAAEGGPLTGMQVESLAEYLAQTISPTGGQKLNRGPRGDK
jgi:mono/diheme cytochrome c family protein